MEHRTQTFATASATDARLIATLRTIDFPATRDDLLRIAIGDVLEIATIDAIRALPRRTYHGATDVLRTLDRT